MTLVQLWRRHRDAIETDLHAAYGVDVDLSDPHHDRTLRRRTWRWLLVRIHGLVDDPSSRVFAAITPDPPTLTGGPP